jgi:hypothetical protein
LPRADLDRLFRPLLDLLLFGVFLALLRGHDLHVRRWYPPEVSCVVGGGDECVCGVCGVCVCVCVVCRGVLRLPDLDSQ